MRWFFFLLYVALLCCTCGLTSTRACRRYEYLEKQLEKKDENGKENGHERHKDRHRDRERRSAREDKPRDRDRDRDEARAKDSKRSSGKREHKSRCGLCWRAPDVLLGCRAPSACSCVLRAELSHRGEQPVTRTLAGS